jgi:MFS family permease
MATSEQAILADSFPPAKRGQAFAIYGIAVVVAPVVGPTLGGWISDTYSWHWVFLINVPMGLISLFLVGTLVNEPSGSEEERERLLSRGLRVDYVGFVLVAIRLGSLEFVLDEGQRNDWFGSNMILGFTLAAAFCLLALVVWELSREDPIIDIRLLGQRQFAACFLCMLGTGAIVIATNADPAAIAAGRAGLYGNAGGACAVSGWPRHHGHDADHRQAHRHGSAEISDHGGRRHRGPCDVAPHGPHRRYQLWLRRDVTHLSCSRPSAALSSCHDGVL